MSKMSQLHALMVDIVCSGVSDELAITLMVDKGLPVEACPEILRVFKNMVSDELEAHDAV